MPHDKRIRVEFNGITVADSSQVLVMHETRLAPVFYFPRDDVRTDLLTPSARRTHCPFKGDATHWSITANGRTVENSVWGYEDPYEESRVVAGYYAFYWDEMDAWYENNIPLAQPPSESSNAKDNPFVDWLVKNAWSTASPSDLVGEFGRRLVAAGIPVARLRVLIRTLHPQLFASGYTWRQDTDEIDTFSPSHEILLSPKYIDSPFAAIIAGEGGIRRRLDGPNPLLDYPVLEELHSEGVTDYVAMPMRFSDGQINIITMTSTTPGGFAVADLGQIYEVLPLMSRLFEVFALHAAAATLLGTYLGGRTGKQVLNGLTKRGDGEHIHAAIWFCDLRNSTVLTERLSRQEYLDTLNQFFDCMVEPIVNRGGEVLKLIGDAVLAIFPIDDKETPARVACGQAVAAAMDARERVDAMNEERRERGEPALDYGIGLHRGDLTYGNVGSSERLDFTVIGSAVNEASRIEDMCKALDKWVLTSSEFAESIDSDLTSVGHHELRGVEEQREIFTLH
jgi:class 3 adenylate cyclase/uncharacterized protein (DUF427 family)